MRNKSIVLFILVAVFMSNFAFSRAETKNPDWPQFGGNIAGTRCISAEFGPKSNTPTMKWEIKNKSYCQTPIISGDYALMDDHSKSIMCFDIKSGRMLWNAKQYASSSRKCADSSNFYLFDGLTKMVCLNLKDGKEKWSKSVNCAGSQLVCHEGKLYYGSTNYYLYCYSAKDGSLLWSFKSDERVFGTPAIADNKIVFGTYNSISCLSLEKTPPTEVLWTNTEVAEKYFSAPAIFDGKVYAIAGTRKFTEKSQVCAFDLKNGKLLWKTEVPKIDISEIAVHEKYVVVGCLDGVAYCLDRLNGKKRWEFATKKQIECSPTIYGNNVIIGSDDGYFYCINISSGKLNWKYWTGTNYFDYAAIGRNKILLCGWEFVCLGD